MSEAAGSSCATSRAQPLSVARQLHPWVYRFPAYEHMLALGSPYSITVVAAVAYREAMICRGVLWDTDVARGRTGMHVTCVTLLSDFLPTSEKDVPTPGYSSLVQYLVCCSNRYQRADVCPHLRLQECLPHVLSGRTGPKPPVLSPRLLLVLSLFCLPFQHCFLRLCPPPRCSRHIPWATSSVLVASD